MKMMGVDGRRDVVVRLLQGAARLDVSSAGNILGSQRTGIQLVIACFDVEGYKWIKHRR